MFIAMSELSDYTWKNIWIPHLFINKKMWTDISKKIIKKKFHTIIELTIVELSDKTQYMYKFYIGIIQTPQQASK